MKKIILSLLSIFIMLLFAYSLAYAVDDPNALLQGFHSTLYTNSISPKTSGGNIQIKTDLKFDSGKGISGNLKVKGKISSNGDICGKNGCISEVYKNLFIGTEVYSDDTKPSSMDKGLYVQVGAGDKGDKKNWKYKYGTKLSVVIDSTRNFELMTTTYPYGGLVLRQYDYSNNKWTEWRNILVENKDGNIGIGTNDPKSKLDVNGSVNIKGDVIIDLS